MTVTAQLLRDIDSQITGLQRLKEIVGDAKGALDAASSASVGSAVAGTLYVHLPNGDTESAKVIARSLAGVWSRELSTIPRSYDYKCTLLGSKHTARIFAAEPIPEPSPLAL